MSKRDLEDQSTRQLSCRHPRRNEKRAWKNLKVEGLKMWFK